MGIIMRSKQLIQTITIGVCAQKTLREESAASVLGITSAGLFLRSTKEKILFLTSSPWRGPLTVNLPDVMQDVEVQIGQEVRLDDLKMDFPAFEVVVNKSACVWQPQPLDADTGNPNEIIRRAEKLCSTLAFKGKSLRFFEVLETVADKENNPSEKRARICAWFLFKGRKEIHNTLLALERFIGRGAGLTPSGDDFTVGYLLAVYYLEKKIDPGIDSFLLDVREKTTALSANLITCAANGSADERLMNALRFLLIGEKDCTEVKKELLSYGSSSGIETLVGMLTAIFIQS